jgi:hypothetical protein
MSAHAVVGLHSEELFHLCLVQLGRTPKKTYKMKKLLTIFGIICTVFFAGCKKDTYVPIIAKCPVVTSTSPVGSAVSVPLGQVITATFNEALDPASVTSSSFTVSGASAVTGTVSFSGLTASFIPTGGLTANTTYTAMITTAVRDTLGNHLQINYVWTFSTGSILAPTVISTDPANNATQVVLNKIVTATFSVPMDRLTLTASTFTLKQGSTAVSGVVSYTGSTASFTPTVNLLPGTVYTATITTVAKNIPGTSLANNYVWTFTTGSLIAPMVISTDPINNAVGVALNKIVTATFSVPMDPATLTASTFTLKQGSTSISGTVSYTGTIASFTPGVNLLSGTVYTATITTGAKNILGTPLSANYIWTFTTSAAKAPPTVISTDPPNNATAVPLNQIVTATFSQVMTPLSVTNTGNFTIKNGSNNVTGSVTYSGNTAIFSPTNLLLSNTVYTGTITNSVKNSSGVAMVANYTWTFTTSSTNPPTVILTSPLNNATSVALNKVLTATFSVPMNPLDINPTTFTLKTGNTFITGAISYAGTTASFTPTVDLISGTVYTATITTGAKNLANVPLASNYVWNFTTKAPLGPSPVNLGSAGNFGILAGVGISNNAGPSQIINLNVGISPGVRSSVTGFPPATMVNGVIYASDDISPPGVAAMLTQAKLDLTNAYLFAAGASTPAPVTVSGDQGGLTLAPGIYKTTSTLLIQSGNLTLDGQGDVNAVWIFQVASGFTTVGGAGGSVILTGGAQAKNVFWQTGSSAIIGDYTSFQGNILALTSITMNSHSTAVGRMLAINAAVVMTSTNTINKP